MFTLSCLSHKVLLPLWTVIIVFDYRKPRYELAHPDHVRECFKGKSFQSSLQTVVDEGLLLNGWVFYFLANNLAMFVQVFFCDQIFNLGGYLTIMQESVTIISDVNDWLSILVWSARYVDFVCSECCKFNFPSWLVI